MNKELLAEWAKRTGATGVSSGTKHVGGVDTNEPCIVIFVPKKRPLAELNPNEIIPKRIDGKLVDVREAIFKALGMTAPARPLAAWTPGGSRVVQYRPTPGGVSIGHYQVTAGTLGTWAWRGERRMVLSNNHVLANSNDCLVGDPILQPGAYDGGGDDDVFGTLSDWVEVVPESTQELNEVDCAIAEPLDESYIDIQIADLATSVDIARAAEVGMRVTKSGRTTKVTQGTVTAIDAALRVQYPSFIAAFENQIMIPNTEQDGAFLAGGDSGSACLELPPLGLPNTIVGLCFAGGMDYACVCPIAPVIDGLGISFNVPVTIEGIVRLNGVPVADARVFAYNLTTNQSALAYLGFVETAADGSFSFHDAIYQYETAIVVAQVKIGISEYCGFKRMVCRDNVNTAIINLSGYAPVANGLWCDFKLNNPDFLICNIDDVEQYYSNLF